MGNTGERLAMGIPYLSVVVGMWCMQSAWLAMLLYHLLIGIFLQRNGWPPVNRFASDAVQWGAVILPLLSGLLLFLLWPWMEPSNGDLQGRLALFGLEGGGLWLFVLWFSVVHPILEESLWRTLDPDPWQLFCVQDLCFAGYHGLVVCWFVSGIWVILCLVVLLSSSMFWRWLTWRSGSRSAALLSHGIADLSIILAVALMAG